MIKCVREKLKAVLYLFHNLIQKSVLCVIFNYQFNIKATLQYQIASLEYNGVFFN